MASLPPKPHSKNRVEQQDLPHMYARHSPLTVSVVFFIVAVVLVPIGVVVIVCGDRTTTLGYRYDDVNNYEFSLGGAGENAVDFTFDGATYSAGTVTRVNFTLEKSLSAPIYLEYVLDPFYQNYRWFAASVDSAQLHGGTGKLTDYCHPYRFPGDATGDSVSGYYSPCGAYPWSLFNDSIALYSDDGSLVCDGGKFDANGTSLIEGHNCRKKGIALKKDVKNNFKAPREISGYGPMWKAGGDPASTDPFLREGYYYREPGHKIPSTLDEDLMVWLNMAFSKKVINTYRVIEVDLPAGEYYFDVTEHFSMVQNRGRKFVQLSTRSWIGGSNHVLGILMIVFGGCSFVMAVGLLLLACVSTPSNVKGW